MLFRTAIILGLLSFSSCVTVEGRLIYKTINEDEDSDGVIMQSEKVSIGKKIADIKGKGSGPMNSACDDLVLLAARRLVRKAQLLRANVIGNVRWRKRLKPVCKQKWGWFLVYPMLLTPWSQNAKVTGEAYRVDAPASLNESFYFIPDDATQREAVAVKIARDLLTITE